MQKMRKVAGEWREVGLRYRKVNGQWRQVVKSFRKVDGVWKQVYVRAVHRPYLVGLENFTGTYKVERFPDGTIHVEVDGRATAGTVVRIGIEFPEIPTGSNFKCTVASFEKSIYQQNDLRFEDGEQEQSTFPDPMSNTPLQFWPVKDFLRIYFDLRTAYNAVQAHFTIKDFEIDGVRM